MITTYNFIDDNNFFQCAITLFNPERANIIHADAIKHEQVL